MPAYDTIYLERARSVLGTMLDSAVHGLNYELDKFWDLFIASDIARRFSIGDCAIIAGHSGTELAYMVLENAGLSVIHATRTCYDDRSEEYWTGWALAYFQWKTMRSFAHITRFVPISQIRALYSPFHEMDIQQFYDELCRLYRLAKPDTKELYFLTVFLRHRPPPPSEYSNTDTV